MSYPFTEMPALCGALRRPRQMLAAQQYDGHKSIHDDAMAAELGLRAGPIRLVQGPLFVDRPYELEREIIALSESARTESAWIRTRVFDGETRALVAEMILNSAVMKASYAAYDREAAALGRGA
jgi:hypothetical protein